MKLIDIIMISISLAMDAFAVSVGKSLSFSSKKYFFLYPFSFSIFQVLMPYLGFSFGKIFSSSISYYDHWVSFLLLFFIGFEMIISSKEYDSSLSLLSLFFLSIATSIDAFCVGITFSFYSISLPFILFMIGMITFLLCFIGCLLGYFFGNVFPNSSYVGGVLLIVIGFKILLEHIGLLKFL